MVSGASQWRQMEQQHRLEQHRYAKPFVGLSTAEEAGSFIAGNNKEKASTCVVLQRWKIMETQMSHRKQQSACIRSLMTENCSRLIFILGEHRGRSQQASQPQRDPELDKRRVYEGVATTTGPKI